MKRYHDQLTVVDWTLEIIGGLGVFLIIGSIAIFYNDLPDMISSHFNVEGKPDEMNNKAILFILPFAAILLYTIMSFAVKSPQVINYLFKITEENSLRLHKNSILMTRMLKAIVVCIFSYITSVTIQTGLGHMQGLGFWFLPIVILLLLSTVVYFISRAFSLK